MCNWDPALIWKWERGGKQKREKNKEIKKQRNKENKHINASQTFGIRVRGCIVDGLDLGELVGPSSFTDSWVPVTLPTLQKRK